jgi:hypothetical protein
VNDLALGRHDEELGGATARSKLSRLEAMGRRKRAEPSRDSRRDELGPSSGVLVSGTRELIDSDEPNAERDRKPHDDHKDGSDRQEGPARSEAGSSDAERP